MMAFLLIFAIYEYLIEKASESQNLRGFLMGAEDEARTRDPNLGKVVLYQLSYFRIKFWWEQRESNPRPSACKADALNQLSYAPVCGADGTRTRDPRRDRPVF